MGIKLSVGIIIAMCCRVKMADESEDLLQAANLKPLKNSTSAVWNYFGFQHVEGVIKDHSHVRDLSFRCFFFAR